MNFTQPIEISRGTHYGNNYFAVYSSKAHRVCHFFSNLEYYNFLTLELNPDVKIFCEQPLKIDIIQEGKIKHAIFDMWVKYRDGREELQEVKYESELVGDDNSSLRSQEQIRREKAWCKSNNIDFCIRTDKTIPLGRFHLSNLNVMAAQLRRYIPTESEYYNPLIIDQLKRLDKVTYADLRNNELLPINNEVSHLCYMYEQGIIDMDIKNQPLSLKTEIRLKEW